MLQYLCWNQSDIRSNSLQQKYRHLFSSLFITWLTKYVSLFLRNNFPRILIAVHNRINTQTLHKNIRK